MYRKRESIAFAKMLVAYMVIEMGSFCVEAYGTVGDGLVAKFQLKFRFRLEKLATATVLRSPTI